MPYVFVFTTILFIMLLLMIVILVPICCVKHKNGHFVAKHPLRALLLFLHPRPELRHLHPTQRNPTTTTPTSTVQHYNQTQPTPRLRTTTRTTIISRRNRMRHRLTIQCYNYRPKGGACQECD